MSTVAEFNLDLPTGLCSAFAVSLMPIAYFLGAWLIPSTQKRNRFLFSWHAYDALTHIFIEGSFLYESFFSYAPISPSRNREPWNFLGYKDRLYGAAYGTGPSARLWQEYAKADFRWATSDPGVVALEILTVLLGGPVAIYVCYLVWKSSSSGSSTQDRGAAKSLLWLVAPALATAELYGGWMTFCPEWLTGSTQLETSNPVYLWFYLFFFNTLWVWVPCWVLWESFKELRTAFTAAEGLKKERKGK